jgi:hypothetical protein
MKDQMFNAKDIKTYSWLTGVIVRLFGRPATIGVDYGKGYKNKPSQSFKSYIFRGKLYVFNDKKFT